ncbi:MAG TPA: N-acetylmuramoyl-L-alanine amidase [Allosphingosinicella sp.]|nr:N-acetylmuramoyl-L-alanine amidase [Allosphingosinicella sp.]
MTFSSDGWLGGAARRPSPNFYNDPNPREIIVMHYTAGYRASSAINTFLDASSQASAHFVVDIDGAITQMVSTNKCAWHAGGGYYNGRPKVNYFSIGIEIVNPGYHFRQPDGSYLNWKRDRPVDPELLAPYPGMTDARDVWVGSAMASWPHFPPAQLDAVEELTLELITAYGSIGDVVGHRDVDHVRKRKVDPGPAFPLRRYRLLLDDRSDQEREPVEMRVAITGATLNVRGGPGTGFETLDWGPLRHGDRVQRLESVGDWFRIRRWFGGEAREGWAYARYVVPLTD